MTSFRFIVNTGVDYFRNWVKQYTSLAPHDSFPTERGRFVLEPMLEADQTGLRPVMDAMYLVEKEDYEEARRAGALIEMVLQPLSPERTEVTLASYSPVVHHYLVSMVAEAAKRWPEIAESAAGPGAPPRIRLSEDEERDFRRYGFKSRLGIEITGLPEARLGNLVRIGDEEIVLPDFQYRLFLRLIVALHETEDGFLSRDELRYAGGIDSEGTLAPEGIDQAVSRLRALVHAALRDITAKQFIEVSRRRLRLSTHWRYVSYDRKALLKHPDPVVRSLAERLPISSRSRQKIPTPA